MHSSRLIICIFLLVSSVLAQGVDIKVEVNVNVGADRRGPHFGGVPAPKGRANGTTSTNAGQDIECATSQGAAPVVQTSYGPVQGFSALNGTVDVFYGIPFAQPPVGQLRFEKPLPPKSWSSVLNATVFPKGCFPNAVALNDSLATSQAGAGPQSEDCLYLNIFSPRNRCQSGAPKLLPVYVAIHGGAYQVGSASMYANYTDIGNSFVRHGIVFVSIQYRLGELGFASTGDDAMPGNNGLWDQTMALRFVRENIARFDGDPHQVTVMGQSAGSGSSSALSLSPHSRDLFQKVISMSGSAVASWVYGSRVVNDTAALVSLLNCSRATSAEVKQCMKSLPIATILNTVLNNNPARPEPNSVKFLPRVDGDFFPKEALELIKEAPPKPTLQGFTHLESLLFTFFSGTNSSIGVATLPWSALNTYSGSDLKTYIRDYVAYQERFGDASEEVTERIYQFYVNGSGSQFARSNYNGSEFFIRQYADLASDLVFVMATIMEIKHKVAAGWPVHMYISNYTNPAAFPPQEPIHECYHGNDKNFIFDASGPAGSSTYSPQDNVIRAFYQEAFRNFVRTGDPSTTSVSTPLQWPPVSSPSQLRYMHVHAPQPAMVENATEALEKYAFWMQLTADFPQYNLVREIPGGQ